ncbi:MAG: hypothetical protein EBS68_10065 [Rhodobacteraceae bacterium]|nr:hypothetical protein [Paracoccaceae bacterium]
MRCVTLSLAIALSSLGAIASANEFAARYTPAALQMQKTCVDYVLRKVNDGAALSKIGLATTRQTKKKTVYQGKADLGSTFDTVYSVDMGENARGVRGCRAQVIRTDYETSRIVFNAMIKDLSKQGGRLVGAPSGGNYTYHQFAFGQTVVQAKSIHAGNALTIDYYIPR